MQQSRLLSAAALLLCASAALFSGEDQATQAPASSPSITGPLQAAPPHRIGGERHPDIVVNGAVSGMGLWQDNHIASDGTINAALTNAQLFVQKTSGWWQFYIQAGAYDIPALGAPFVSTERTLSELYGPVPVAYLKLAPAKNTSILIGSLPTLMGAESTFTFQNMNINRGLLWNQENAVNRGIQANQAIGKFSASLSWNDGFYSSRYSWLSGSLTYSYGSHSVSFQGMGNLSRTVFQSLATPVQNNSRMFAIVYAYAKGRWIVQPYAQYSNVPTNPRVGVRKGASTRGAALLLSRSVRHGFSLSARGEYISSSGNTNDDSVNLLYGPGSAAWSATLTPTYQAGRFFVRGDLSFVRVKTDVPGYAFGPSGTNRNQPRAAMEAGLLF